MKRLAVIIFALSLFAPFAVDAAQCCLSTHRAAGCRTDECDVTTCSVITSANGTCDSGTQVDCASDPSCKNAASCCVAHNNTTQKVIDCQLHDPGFDCSQYTTPVTTYARVDQFCNQITECANFKDAAPPAPPPAAAAPETKFDPIYPVLSVPIPGLELPDVFKVHVTDTGVQVPFIAVYFAAIYKVGIGAAAVLAVIMMMVGGFTWIVAAGSVDKIGSAKKMISNAIVGLLIAVGSYTVLSLINPDLVSFKALTITLVKQQLFVSSEDTNLDLTDADRATTAAPTGKVPLFKQYASEWASVSYGGCGTIQTSGCGPTSAAMVMSSYGAAGANPAAVANAFASGGFRTCSPPSCSNCNGTAYAAFSSAAIAQFGFAGESIDTKSDAILSLLKDGKPVVVSVGPSIFTSKGHFIVLTGGNADGTIEVNDPNKNVYKGTPYGDLTSKSIPQDLVFPNIKAAFYIHPK